MMLIAREDNDMPRYHIPFRAFDRGLPDWKYMPLCRNGGLDLRRWQIVEPPQFRLGALCGVCRRVFAAHALEHSWADEIAFVTRHDPARDADWSSFGGWTREEALTEALYWHAEGYERERVDLVEIARDRWLTYMTLAGGECQLTDRPEHLAALSATGSSPLPAGTSTSPADT